MKTVDDLYWLAFVLGSIGAVLLVVIVGILWHMLRMVTLAAARAGNIDDAIYRAWHVKESGEKGDF